MSATASSLLPVVSNITRNRNSLVLLENGGHNTYLVVVATYLLVVLTLKRWPGPTDLVSLEMCKLFVVPFEAGLLGGIVFQ